MPLPADPVAALWQSATTLREHRDDCHVSLLAAAGMNGLAALVLFSLSEGIDAQLFMDRRGWSADDWEAAIEDLKKQQFISPSGQLANKGAQLRAKIEERTDELAITPYLPFGEARIEELIAALERAAIQIISSAEIPFPNPMGLPSLRR